MSMRRQLVLTVPVLLVLCLTLGSAALAVPPDRNRSEVLGGAGGDRFFTAVQSDGTILFGGLKDGVAGLGDAWLYATVLDGNPLIDRTYPSVSGRPAAIRALATGDGLLAAGLIGREGIDLDVFVMRLTEDGHIVWQASLELVGDQMLGDLVTLSDGGALIVGDTLAPDDDRTDAWVVRLDTAGAIRWQKILGSPGDDKLRTAVETARVRSRPSTSG